MAAAMVAPDWVAQHAKTSPDSLANIDVASGRKFTYRQFNARVAALTNVLLSKFGVTKGDRIVVLSRNDTDMFEIQFACQRAGAIFIPLNWRLAVVELDKVVSDATPVALFYNSDFRSAAEQLQSLTPIPHLVELRGGQPSEYERLISETSPVTYVADRTPEDTATLLYTSGTTGRPKGVQNTYSMALCNAIVLGSAFRLNSSSRALVVLPLFHTGGLNIFSNPIFFYGGTNVVLREFDPTQVVSILKDREFGISHILAVPTIYGLLQAEAGFAQGWTTEPYGLAVSAAPCPVPLIQSYAEHGLLLRQGWGMTEVGPQALLSPYEQRPSKYGSSGLPSMFVSTALVDPEGQPVADGEIGELLVKGPSVTTGYRNQPEATAQAFRDGWFRTGDAAYRDEDGYHFIVDRLKDMYISGGENVYPAEVEHVISQLPDVAECAVVRMSDEKWGEVGRAFIVRKGGSSITPEIIVAHCDKHLARFKIPKDVRFVDALPRTASGKIIKAQLREPTPAANS